MKKLMTIAATVALSMGVSTAALAQERDYTSAYNFAGVQVGAQATLTHYNIGDLVTPQFAVQFGRYFNDKVGARVHLMGYENKGGFQESRFPFLTQDTDYKFKAATLGADLLMNMTNILNPNRECHKLDWILLTGFGVNYTWDYDEFNTVIAQSNNGNYYTGPILGESKRNSFSGRLGTQVNYNINDAFTVGAELQANFKNDCYNLKYNDKCDWQVAALVGLTYNFGYKTKAKAEKVEKVVEPIYETRVDTVWYDDIAYKTVEEDAVIKRDIHYSICKSDPVSEQMVAEIADFVKTHKDVKVSVTGYADKGTGNPTINMGYSKQRAEAVTNALINAGVPAEIITTDWKGDTIQPFAENDENRVAITVAQGRGEKKEKVVTKKFRLEEKQVRVN